MNWSTDMNAAPRGEEKTTTITVGDNQRTRREYHVAPVWLAWADGSVTRSYWVPESKYEKGRWAGRNPDEQPVAWQIFVTPDHPMKQAAA